MSPCSSASPCLIICRDRWSFFCKKPYSVVTCVKPVSGPGTQSPPHPRWPGMESSTFPDRPGSLSCTLSPRRSKWLGLLLVLLQGFKGFSFGTRASNSLLNSCRSRGLTFRAFELARTFPDFFLPMSCIVSKALLAFTTWFCMSTFR